MRFFSLICFHFVRLFYQFNDAAVVWLVYVQHCSSVRLNKYFRMFIFTLYLMLYQHISSLRAPALSHIFLSVGISPHSTQTHPPMLNAHAEVMLSISSLSDFCNIFTHTYYHTRNLCRRAKQCQIKIACQMQIKYSIRKLMLINSVQKNWMTGETGSSSKKYN